MTTRRLLLVLAVSLGLLAPATAASASCMLDERPIGAKIDEANIVFVGRVTGLRDHDRIAQFRVEEVWKGKVPPEVVVHGGPDDPQSATSNDRTWSADQRYLVFPYREGGELRDNFCTPTAEWRAAFGKARPDGAVSADETEEPRGGADDGASEGGPAPTAVDSDAQTTSWLAIGIGVAIALAAVATGLFLRGRRRSSPAV